MAPFSQSLFKSCLYELMTEDDFIRGEGPFRTAKIEDDGSNLTQNDWLFAPWKTFWFHFGRLFEENTSLLWQVL